jgi:hypothetical protein
VNLDGHNTVFGRVEYMQKTGRDLALSAPDARRVFGVGNAVLGYLLEASPFASLIGGLGVRGSLNVLGADLAPVYGSRLPLGVMIFVRVRPAEMAMGAMAGAHSRTHHAL